MTRFIFRLDDACERMNLDKWNRIEELLDKYEIKPLVGVIPDCKDTMMNQYEVNLSFWDKVKVWIEKDWTIALHGYHHLYTTDQGGVNPIHNRSEFAGVDLKKQKEMIRRGISIFAQHGVVPQVFFAPSHTFDKNTIQALKEESNIRIISDTIAYDTYNMDDITFVPQQSGKVRYLPFSLVTFCYHPNDMQEDDFNHLEFFFHKYKEKFIPFPLGTTVRQYGIVDRLLRNLYMARRK